MASGSMVKGIPFPNVPWIKTENIERNLEFVPKDDDIIIASFPKTGSYWVQYIAIQITSNGEYFPPMKDLSRVTPFGKMKEPEGIDNLKRLRIYKNHYRYDMMKKNPKSKVLYIYRNPEDVLVSFFCFMENVREETLDFDKYFEGFLTGNIEFGCYFEHVLSFFSHKDSGNLLLISYEKLHANPKEETLRIARFLGEEYYAKLSEDEFLLNEILKNTSFENMKNKLTFDFRQNHHKENSEKKANTLNYFRKGIVGDGKNWLSIEQQNRLRDKMAEILKGTEVLKELIEQ